MSGKKICAEWLPGDFINPIGVVIKAGQSCINIGQVTLDGIEVKGAYVFAHLSIVDNLRTARRKVRREACSVIGMSFPFPPLDGSAQKNQKFPAAPEMGIDPTKRYTATMETSMGTLVIALDPIKAPKTVNSFVYLAAYHYYDDIIFHRIIKGFVCQGGDPTGTGRGGPGYQYADELPKAGQYQIGSLAMANAGPNTNGSQFFLISGPSGVQLPPSYALFGQVVKGLEVVEAMQNVETDRSDKPLVDVVIKSVTVTVAD